MGRDKAVARISVGTRAFVSVCLFVSLSLCLARSLSLSLSLSLPGDPNGPKQILFTYFRLQSRIIYILGSLGNVSLHGFLCSPRYPRLLRAGAPRVPGLRLHMLHAFGLKGSCSKS